VRWVEPFEERQAQLAAGDDHAGGSPPAAQAAYCGENPPADTFCCVFPCGRRSRSPRIYGELPAGMPLRAPGGGPRSAT
jgi:hypothetical protein